MSQRKFQLSKIQLLFHRYSKIFTIHIYDGVLSNFLLEPQGVMGFYPKGKWIKIHLPKRVKRYLKKDETNISVLIIT